MKKISNENVVFLILSLGLAAYTFIRAAGSSITHDEVGNYLGYSIYPVRDIILFTNLQLGNHVLNSLLVKLTTSLFGISEFTLRLPNLIAHLLYLYFSWKIIRLLTKDKYVAIAGFIMINVNPYLLDFFSISRGYGLEISMLVIGIYLMMKFWQQGKPLYIWGSMIMNALGVLSNFNFIPMYFSIILLINFLMIIDLIRLKKPFKSSILALLKVNMPVLIVSAGLAALIVGPIIRLEVIGEFSARANKDGFWDNLFRSVIRHSLYGQFLGDTMQVSLTIVFQVLSAMFVMLLVWHIYKDRWNATRSGLFQVFSLLMIVCLWFFLQHVLMGSRYPQQRTALFILPLFLFTLIACFDIIAAFKGFQVPVRIVAGLVSLLILFHFYNTANFRYYFDWQYDADTKQMLTENLDNMKSVAPNNERRVNFGIYWLYEPGIDFYLRVNKINWVKLIIYRNSFAGQADFYYIPPEFKDSLNKFNPVKLKDYPLSRSELYKQISK